jgi:hypothetical protein
MSHGSSETVSGTGFDPGATVEVLLDVGMCRSRRRDAFTTVPPTIGMDAF